MPGGEKSGSGVLAICAMLGVGIIVSASALGPWYEGTPEIDRNTTPTAGASSEMGLAPTAPDNQVDIATGDLEADRELVISATDAAQPDLLEAAEPGACISTPPGLQASIETLTRWMHERNQKLNSELQMPLHSWQVFHQRVSGLEAVLRPMEEEMGSIVAAISDDKWRRGDVEYFENPRSLDDATARHAAREKLMAARRATKEGQRVIQGGSADRSYVTRVNMEDSALLHGLTLERWSLLDDLFLQLSVLTFPQKLATNKR